MIGFFLGPAVGVLIALAIILVWRRNMAASINDLVTEVEQTETVIDSTITLLAGVVTRIKELVAANSGLDAFAALAERLDLKTNALAAAVAATTAELAEPVDNPPVVEEPPAPPVAEEPIPDGVLIDVPAGGDVEEPNVENPAPFDPGVDGEDA